MHSKLMILFHPQYVRLVVPTANLVPYDWGEQGGCMENVRQKSSSIPPFCLSMFLLIFCVLERFLDRPSKEEG